jgi:hypothetical protein
MPGARKADKLNRLLRSARVTTKARSAVVTRAATLRTTPVLGRFFELRKNYLLFKMALFDRI